MKLAVLGGGGFRTPFIYQALLRDVGAPRVSEVALLDPDPQRLAVQSRILGELADGFPDAPTIRATADPHEAISGADFVFTAIRVAGLAGRQHDEHVALDLGVLGQETTGPGGIAYALRTIPVMMDYARLIRELAPDAYVLNFTNPAGIITEALQEILGDRVFGICDTPAGLGRRAAALLEVPHTEVRVEYAGLNHLGWLQHLTFQGRDLLPDLLANDHLLDDLEEGHVFDHDWLRDLGVMPNEYLYYYYSNREAVRAIIDGGITRGDFLASTQSAFYAEASAMSGPIAPLWRATLDERSDSYMVEAKGGTQGHPIIHDHNTSMDPSRMGYAGVALAAMNAISRNEPTRLILNVRNRGAIAGMPADAVVEVPTLVDANGVQPLTTEPLELSQLGLIQQLKACERHAIAAALHHSPVDAVKAFALHPLVDSVDLGRALFAGYCRAIPEVAAVFGQ